MISTVILTEVDRGIKSYKVQQTNKQSDTDTGYLIGVLYSMYICWNGSSRYVDVLGFCGWLCSSPSPLVRPYWHLDMFSHLDIFLDSLQVRILRLPVSLPSHQDIKTIHETIRTLRHVSLTGQRCHDVTIYTSRMNTNLRSYQERSLWCCLFKYSHHIFLNVSPVF